MTDTNEIATYCATWAAKGVTTSTYGLGNSFNEELMVAMVNMSLRKLTKNRGSFPTENLVCTKRCAQLRKASGHLFGQLWPDSLAKAAHSCAA